MRKLMIILLLSLWVLPSCYRRICPAYHSAFLLHDTLCYQCFSLFSPDSMPLPKPKAYKTQVGLIKRTSNDKIAKRQRILLTKKIYHTPEDTSAVLVDSLAALADAADSAGLSTSDDPLALEETDVLVETDGLDPWERTPEEAQSFYRYGYDPSDDYEVDQENYMELFGSLLIVTQEIPEDSLVVPDVEEGFDVVPGVYDGPQEEGTEAEESEEEGDQ